MEHIDPGHLGRGQATRANVAQDEQQHLDPAMLYREDSSMPEMFDINPRSSLQFLFQQSQIGTQMPQYISQADTQLPAVEENMYAAVNMPGNQNYVGSITEAFSDEVFWDPFLLPVSRAAMSLSPTPDSGPLQLTPSSNPSAYTGVDFEYHPPSSARISPRTGQQSIRNQALLQYPGPAMHQASEFPEPAHFQDEERGPLANMDFQFPATQADHYIGTQFEPAVAPHILHGNDWGLEDVFENVDFSFMDDPSSLQSDNSAAVLPNPSSNVASCNNPTTDSVANYQNAATLEVLKINQWLQDHHCVNPMLPRILPRHIEARPEQTPGVLALHPNPLPSSKKRKPNTEAQRERTKAVRRSGACLRCRILKEKCDQNTPCARCLEVFSGTAKIWDMPCYTERLGSVIAFRAGNARAGMKRSVPRRLKWDSSDLAERLVTLHYPFKNIGYGHTPGLTIKCRKFHPVTSDVLEEPWTTSGGDVITLTSTPYGCYDVDGSVYTMEVYLKACKSSLLDEARFGVEDEILKLGMEEAQRYSSKHQESAVALAMNIRAASHFSKTRMQVSGDNALGLSYFNDSRVRESEMVPIPAVLDVQVDYLAIKYMLGQMKLLSALLGKLIFPRAKGNWYEIYLTVFVLLHSLETVHIRQAEIVQRFTDLPLQNRVRRTAEEMKEEWQHSAKVLIYHYRAILQGMVPFGNKWDTKHANDLKRNCNLDTEALTYFRKLSSVMVDQKAELKRASESNVNNDEALPLVWISRLYIDDYFM